MTFAGLRCLTWHAAPARASLAMLALLLLVFQLSLSCAAPAEHIAANLTAPSAIAVTSGDCDHSIPQSPCPALRACLFCGLPATAQRADSAPEAIPFRFAHAEDPAPIGSDAPDRFRPPIVQD